MNALPPHSLEAEQAVLGGLLLEPEAWDDVSPLLAPESFYKPSHQKIYEVLYSLKNRNEATDLVTTVNLLREKDLLEQIGGQAYLTDLLDKTPSAANIAYHAKIVSEKKTLRRVIHVSQKIIERAYKQDFEDILDFLNDTEAHIFSISEDKKLETMTSASQLMELSMDSLHRLSERNEDIIGIASGFNELDHMTAGFKESEMIVVASRPSMGKTAFLVNLTMHALLQDKKSVAFFSVEMSKEQMALRMLSQMTRIPLGHLRVGKLADKSWDILMKKASILSEAKLFIDDTAPISPTEIRSKCRKLKSKNNLDMIVIDYLQLMNLNHKVENREREVSEISRQLKALSKELKVSVIALAQLNRSVESRSDKRPLLSDLRESGSIEQDADLIMMLYRDDYYNHQSEDKGTVELIVNKQRNGPIGTVKLKWNPEYGLFSNYMEPQPPSPSGPRPYDTRPTHTKTSLEGMPDLSETKNFAE